MSSILIHPEEQNISSIGYRYITHGILKIQGKQLLPKEP
jgi:hypothetical protein